MINCWKQVVLYWDYHYLDLRKLELSLPPLAEQRAIAGVLGDLDGELAGLRARRAKLGLVKGGMMEALLGGGVRLV